MKILSCHNYYLYRGGEDQSFEDEVGMLREHGNEVETYTVHSNSIRSSLAVARRLIWNREHYRALTEKVKDFRPDVVHFTNTFPLISLAGPAAARSSGAAVVASLRNYRSLCANSYFLRDGKVCEDCLGKLGSLPAILHSCYRGSRISSVALAGTIAYQRATKQWERYIDIFYAPSEFARKKLIEGGFPADRMRSKPNFVANHPAVGRGEGDSDGPFVLFTGRLSPEKGLRCVLEAWKTDASLPRLKIVGEGPDEAIASAAAKNDSRIEVLGKLPLSQLLEVMGQATALLMTSIWYETFGRTIVESFSKGTPVIASRMGSMAELITEGVDGYLFDPGNAKQLSLSVHKLLNDRSQLAEFRRNARTTFDSRYTAERNHALLMEIYHQAIARRSTVSK